MEQWSPLGEPPGGFLLGTPTMIILALPPLASGLRLGHWNEQGCGMFLQGWPFPLVLMTGLLQCWYEDKPPGNPLGPLLSILATH